MTLSSRNNFFLSFIIVSLLLIIVITIAAFSQIFQGVSYETIYTTQALISSSFFLFNTNLYAVMLAILFLSLYAPITTIIILCTYEKTLSPEIVYFAGFLFSCSLEIVRFMIPIVNSEPSSIHYIIGRILFFARFFSCLCFLFASLFAHRDASQETDKNIMLIAAISIIFASLIPINTTVIFQSFSIGYGFFYESIAIKTFFYCITFVTFFVFGYRENISEYKKAALGFGILILGYVILCSSASIAFSLLGCFLLTAGTHFYLNSIHRYYLWI